MRYNGTERKPHRYLMSEMSLPSHSGIVLHNGVLALLVFADVSVGEIPVQLLFAVRLGRDTDGIRAQGFQWLRTPY